MNEEIKNLIEEEAENYSERIKKNTSFKSNERIAATAGFARGATIISEIILSKWQEAERWRKVEEELPDPDTSVLCRMKSPNVIVEGFIYKYNGIAKIETQPDFEFEDYANGEVIEWKPIS